MARTTKLTNEVQQKIGDGISLGLTYALAASAAGVTYQTFNQWMKLGRDSTSGKYFEFYKHIKQRNAEGVLRILQKLNDAAKAGNGQAIKSRPTYFSSNIWRRSYRNWTLLHMETNHYCRRISKNYQ